MRRALAARRRGSSARAARTDRAERDDRWAGSWRWLPAVLLTTWLRGLEPRRRDLGPLGERLAARYLVRRGLRPLARNLHRPQVEVDLLLRDGDVLVLCEVKCSRLHLDAHLDAPRWRPGDRAGPGRRERLAAAARGLSRAARASGYRGVRVDLVEVWIRGPRRRVRCAWHRDLVRDGPLAREA